MMSRAPERKQRGDTALRIGEVAQIVGMTTKAIRYYESLGLLDPPQRTAKGYRVYGSSAVGQLEFIRRAKAVGFSLEEIRRLAQTARSGDSIALRHQVVAVLEEKLDEAERHVLALRERQAWLRTRRRLAVLATTAPACTCHGLAADCPCLPAGEEEADAR